MNTKQLGSVLVDHQIEQLVAEKALTLDSSLIQPASVDLAVGAKIWQASSLPSLARGFNAAHFIEHYCSNPHDLTKGSYVLFPGISYFCEIKADFKLPKKISAYTNPKSSSGRIDLLCLLVANGAHQYNVVPHGYTGKTYLLIIPQSFHIVLHEDITLVQMRFFEGERNFLDNKTLEQLHKEEPLVLGQENTRFESEGLVLHLDLECSPSNLVGQRYGKPIDLALRGQDSSRYFIEKALDHNQRLTLEPDEFLLAVTQEGLCIPPQYCGEMVAWTERLGPIQSHFAGFFDPGFGYGVPGGSRGVCEIRNISKSAIQLAHDQEICILRFEALADTPRVFYGRTMAKEQSNYQGQNSVKVAKYFL